MKLQIYNTLSRKKEEFKPIEEGKARFYSCGPTTYDFAHIGNARAFVVGDMIARTLKVLGYEVTFVRNFTDIDDKIIDRAKERGVDAQVHAEEYVQECLKDFSYLGMTSPDHMPKVTQTLPEIISMIETLIEKNVAYCVDGEVFFHVPAFEDYGKLSGVKQDDLQHGIRIEVQKHKKNPSDFVLWKPSGENIPGWDSPWGRGRPGWHIECSAMAKKFLGDRIDIHHGGVDLTFPHHENETAQSEAANGCSFCNYWCHNEFLNFGSEKMSKSLGNVITIRSFVQKFCGEVLRHVLISSHYRTKLTWSEELIANGVSELERIHEFIKEVQPHFENATGEHKEILKTIELMKEELSNDFNTPAALAHFFTLIRKFRSDYSTESGAYCSLQQVLKFTQEAMGIISFNADELLEKLNECRKNLGGQKLGEKEIESLIEERKQAKADKNYSRADEIRKNLKEQKVILKDHPDGSTSYKYE